MHKLFALLPALAACSGDVRALTEMGALSAKVNVDVGVPEQPGTGGNYGTGFIFDLTYAAPGCLTLDGDAEGTLDGLGASYFVAGGIDSGEVHGRTETSCVTPSFYLDYLPSPRPTSIITLADDSAELSIAVDELLVNPAITVGALHPGTEVFAQVAGTRPIADARIWFIPEFEDPNGIYWYADATITGTEIRFTVPTNARGTGTFGIETTITDHRLDCVGFAACDVTTRGGASFRRTIL